MKAVDNEDYDVEGEKKFTCSAIADHHTAVYARRVEEIIATKIEKLSRLRGMRQ